MAALCFDGVALSFPELVRVLVRLDQGARFVLTRINASCDAAEKVDVAVEL